MQPQVVFDISLKGLRDFLSQRSEPMVKLLLSHFDDAIAEWNMDIKASLTENSLETIKSCTDFWETGFTQDRYEPPPMKGHCEFYDSLIKQLKSGENISFQKAFVEANIR